MSAAKLRIALAKLIQERHTGKVVVNKVEPHGDGYVVLFTRTYENIYRRSCEATEHRVCIFEDRDGEWFPSSDYIVSTK